MDVTLLLIVAASGLCAVSSHVGRQYHFVYEQKIMTEAQSYCRGKYTDLATVDNMEDVKILNDMADLNKLQYPYPYRAWIGLYDDVDSWRWSHSNRSFYKDKEAEFRNWKSGEPNNDGRELCSRMGSEGEWVDRACNSTAEPLCMYITGSNVTFILVKKNMTWTEAHSYCREKYTDLVSVRNMDKNQEVKKLLNDGQEVWIGLFRDSWKWSDGSTSSFRYWKQKRERPDGACMVADFSQSGRWEEWSCGMRRAFICYSRVGSKKQVIRLSLRKQISSLDLNKPAVAEHILEKLRDGLKDQGLNEDVKLSWRKQSDGKIFHKDEETKKKRNTCLKKEEL